MENHVEIVGVSGLVRDMNSHAVINKDSNARKQVLATRAKRKQDAEDLTNLKNDVKELKDSVNQILDILTHGRKLK